MAKTAAAALRKLPSVDEVLRSTTATAVIERFGRSAVVGAVRRVISESRARAAVPAGTEAVLSEATLLLEGQDKPSLRPVFNLTGTVLHTNLGRALLAEGADGPWGNVMTDIELGALDQQKRRDFCIELKAQHPELTPLDGETAQMVVKQAMHAIGIEQPSNQ